MEKIYFKSIIDIFPFLKVNVVSFRGGAKPIAKCLERFLKRREKNKINLKEDL